MSPVPNGRSRRLPTFAARGTRKLSARQQALVDTVLPQLAVPLGDASAGGAGQIDPARLFDPPPAGVWLEIGFGGGEHLVGQASRHPDTGFIGCEPFLDGVAKALTAIEAGGLGNVRLHQGDARDVMDRLYPATIARCFILFPDPWPKARHHKRRLIQSPFLDELSRVLAPGAQVRFATDVAGYADWAMERFHAHPAYHWSARRADDWRQAPPDHVTTRYEAKQLGDVAPVFFDFEHRPEPGIVSA